MAEKLLTARPVKRPDGADVRTDSETREKRKRLFYNIVFAVGWAACLPVGAFPQGMPLFALLLIGCMTVSFFDDNFYLYTALFMFMRYKVLFGDTPVYRLYSYLLVVKLVFDLKKIRLRTAYLPAVVVFALHSVFALGRSAAGMRLGLNALVDLLLIYLVLAVVPDKEVLFRRFLLAFLLGGVLSGVYGWTNADMTVNINIRGAGSETVSRNFGSLGDPNFAGLYYITCFYTALLLKSIPKWAKALFAALFFVLLLQTASLSALLTLALVGAVVIVLKYRVKALFILLGVVAAGGAALSVLLTVPQFREIPEISGLLIRIAEKLSYISMGRWDLLTTDRYALWQAALKIFSQKSILGQLFGGSVITVMFIDFSTVSMACHQSIIQALLNFGVLGTACVYLPFLAVLGYRLLIHFTKKSGYACEDLKIVQIIFPFCFFVFGMSVDFFTDWAYLFFYFI